MILNGEPPPGGHFDPSGGVGRGGSEVSTMTTDLQGYKTSKNIFLFGERGH